MHKRKANFQQTRSSCKRCNEAGRAEHAKSHDDEFCGFAGGNYENDFAGAKKAAKASKRAWKRRQSSQELVNKSKYCGQFCVLYGGCKDRHMERDKLARDIRQGKDARWGA